MFEQRMALLAEHASAQQQVEQAAAHCLDLLARMATEYGGKADDPHARASPDRDEVRQEFTRLVVNDLAGLLTAIRPRPTDKDKARQVIAAAKAMGVDPAELADAELVIAEGWKERYGYPGMYEEFYPRTLGMIADS